MDGFEKLLLTNSLISSTSNDSKTFIYGFIIGFMSCIIILIVVMTCYSTLKIIANDIPIVHNNAYTIPRHAIPNVSLNTIQDMERFINYHY